jgi:hypothetical protein
VAPKALVESRNTLPSRSALMNAVVARSGSSRSARAAMALVAAAADSRSAAIGTYTCSPLAPLVLTAPARPAPSSASLNGCCPARALITDSGLPRSSPRIAPATASR